LSTEKKDSVTEEKVWKMGDLKPPVPFREMPNPGEYSFRNYLRKFFGPGTITGMGAVAGFELMNVPYFVSRGYLGICWLYTLATVFSCLILREAARYTLATGENSFMGLFRMKPKHFWAIMWVGLSTAGSILPGWVSSGGTAMAWLTGVGNWQTWGVIGILLCTAILLFAKQPYGALKKVLEYAAFGIVLIAFLSCFAVGSPAKVIETIASWFLPLQGPWTPGLIATLGPMVVVRFLNQPGGGVGALNYTQWIQEEGYGMAAHMPKITGLRVKAEEMPTHGYIFDWKDKEQKRRYDVWMKYLTLDSGLFYGGTAILTTMVFSYLAASTFTKPVKAEDAPIAMAIAMSKVLGPAGWYIFLFMVVIRLWLQPIGSYDSLGRQMAVAVYMESEKARKWPYRNWYLLMLAIAVTVGCAFVLGAVAQPYVIWLISGIWVTGGMGGSTIHMVYMNSKYLPEELRPSKAMQIIMYIWGAVMVVCSIYTLGNMLKMW